MAIFRQKPPNRGGIECRCGRQKSQFSTNIWLSIVDCWSANNNCDGRPCSLPHRAPRISESMFITTSMDDHDEEKRREQNLIVRSRKSEAEVINNRTLRSTFYSVEANYWQIRSIARPFCDSRATCYKCKKNCCFITMCKAHSKLTHIKQQIYFYHLKRPGYNTEFLLYPRPFRW